MLKYTEEMTEHNKLFTFMFLLHSDTIIKDKYLIIITMFYFVIHPFVSYVLSPTLLTQFQCGNFCYSLKRK